MMNTSGQTAGRAFEEGVKSVNADRQAGGIRKRSNQTIILFALAILLNALLNQSIAGRPDLLKIGDKIPSFQLKAISGVNVSGADFVGKPTVYFYYADWCPCSHASVKYIKKARADYRDAGLAFMAIGMQGTSDKLEEFAKKYELDFPVSVKGGDDVARSMGVRTTPTTLFVDEAGVVCSIFVGKIKKYEEISDGLNSIMKTDKASISG
ncbi:MAG: peroxiredoxin family protein [Nitrospinota bacterium]